MGGACGVQEEPGKQNPRSCRAQELARSCAQERERQKKGRFTGLSANRLEEQTQGNKSARERWGVRCHRANRNLCFCNVRR